MKELSYEDFVANALIEVNKYSGARKVSIEQVENYRQAVMERLQETDEKVSCYINRERFKSFQEDYSDWFTVVEEDSTMIHMNHNIMKEDLIEQFRGYLSLEYLIIFMNPDITQSLGCYGQLEKKNGAEMSKHFVRLK